MCKISPVDLEMVKKILKTHVPGCKVRAFGSRVNGGGARKYSDLDLVIIGKKKLSARSLADLKDAFQESDLPFRVDVLDWHRISAGFKEIIDAKHEVLLNP